MRDIVVATRFFIAAKGGQAPAESWSPRKKHLSKKNDRGPWECNTIQDAIPPRYFPGSVPCTTTTIVLYIRGSADTTQSCDEKCDSKQKSVQSGMD